MRLVKILNNIVGPVTARAIKNKDNKLYFNITFGSIGVNLWEVRMLLDNKYFTPKTLQDTLTLDQDNYVITPFKNSNSENIQDGRGNSIYLLREDESAVHKKDVLLFWEIPNYNDKNVKYTINGIHNVIGEGVTGKERGNDFYTSPAVIVELLSDCTLKWESDTHTQTVNFDYANGKFSIGLIENKE